MLFCENKTVSEPYSKAPAPTVIKFIAQFLGGDPQIFNKFLVNIFDLSFTSLRTIDSRFKF